MHLCLVEAVGHRAHICGNACTPHGPELVHNFSVYDKRNRRSASCGSRRAENVAQLRSLPGGAVPLQHQRSRVRVADRPGAA